MQTANADPGPLPDRYLVACARRAPVKNIYLTEATSKSQAATCATHLDLETPPIGNFSMFRQLMHLRDHSRKFAEIFALPRNQWITLPARPALDPHRNETILGEVLMELEMGSVLVADFHARGDIVEIVPHNPEFTARWLTSWLEKVREAQALYRERRQVEINARDPYKDFR